MQFDTIIERTQNACGLNGDEAAHAMRTLLATLAERLPETERRHLADQLPGELKDPLINRNRTAPFNLEEFYNRIAAREGIRYAPAVDRARCLAAILRQVVSAGEIEDVRACLPDEYAELFGKKPSGPLSPS